MYGDVPPVMVTLIDEPVPFVQSVVVLNFEIVAAVIAKITVIVSLFEIAAVHVLASIKLITEYIAVAEGVTGTIAGLEVIVNVVS